MMDFSEITNEPLDNCVYVHINKQTGEMYIGRTNHIKNRWVGQGNAYKKCPDFYEAIQEYGWDNFEHIVLIDNISKKMACIFECELIEKYNTIEQGYNLSVGSWNHKDYFTKPIYQYDFNGNFIQMWRSAMEAEKAYGIPIFMRNKSAAGFQWSYEYVTSMPPYKTEKDHRFVPIYQYDKDGNFIKEWQNQKDAIEYYGKNVPECANGKWRTAHGYRWSYEKVEKLPPLEPIRHNRKRKSKPLSQYDKTPKIYRFDLNGNVVKIYNNCAEINNNDGKRSVVYKICEEQSLSIYRDSIWAYEEKAFNGYVQKVIEKYRKDHHKIIQYDLNGNYIRTFDSMKEVVDNGYCHSGVYNVCNRKGNASGGYQWRYEYDSPPEKITNYNRKNGAGVPVIQKTLDGVFVQRFESARAAALSLNGNNGSNILEVCKGKRKTAFNYKWEFDNEDKEVEYGNCT